MFNLNEIFHSYLRFTVIWCRFMKLLTQREADCDALKAHFVLMVITCFSALIVMLSLASLPSFLEDKTTHITKKRERKNNSSCVIFARNLSKLNAL